MRITRRATLAAAGGLVIAAGARDKARAATSYEPPAALEAAARKEGRLILYSANLAESEQEIIAAFNKRFPFISVALTRSPGGVLYTRIRTEAAAGKLVADVIDHSDRALLLAIEDLFQDYAPPNADSYLPGSLVSSKLWPRTTVIWSLSSNSALVKTAPRSWWDLTRPEYGNGQIEQVVAPSGGTTWTRAMFERQVLGEDYWAKQAATKPRLFPSNAPASDAMVRGEVLLGPLLYNAVLPKQRDGAPIAISFPKEGVPITPFAAGIPKTAANPNAARLFMDWSLSDDAQALFIRELGFFSSMKTLPFNPEGYDPATVKAWLPDFQQFQALHAAWIADWNRIYGYRQ